VQADTLYLAGWVLLITTLPRAHWSAQQVLRLYQARWHIELGAEAYETAGAATHLALYHSGDGLAHDHSALVGMGVAGRRGHGHSPGDA